MCRVFGENRHYSSKLMKTALIHSEKPRSGSLKNQGWDFQCDFQGLLERYYSPELELSRQKSGFFLVITVFFFQP